MTIDCKDGKLFLDFVTEKLQERIAHLSEAILEGQKDIEGMHEYYWENAGFPLLWKSGFHF